MKIALINVRSDFTAYEPRGILQIGAALKEAGHEVFLIDPLYSKIDYEKIAFFNPDIIGISFMSLHYYSTRKIVQKIRSFFADIPLVAGGVHPTVDPESALKELGFNYCVIGEGELTVVELVGHLQDKRPSTDLPCVKGIAYLDENREMQVTEERPLIQDLDTIPFSAREEIEMEDYLVPPGYIRSTILNRVGVIYSSRGCPGRCTFCCSVAMCKRKYRQRSVSHVMKEIDFLIKRYQIEGIYFSDEVFSQDRHWVVQLCEKFKGYKMPWGLSTRVVLVDFELLKLLKEAGCVQIDYGVESGSDAVLKALKKDISRRIIQRTFDLTHKAKIRAFATVMVGLPDETLEDVNQTIELLKIIKPDFTLCGFFVPLPGSEAYRTLVAQGRINKDFFKTQDYHLIFSKMPLINVSAMPDKELSQAKGRIDQYTALRNYASVLTLRNVSFYLKVILLSFSSPIGFGRNVFAALGSGRFDRLAGYLLNHYQTRLRKRARKIRESQNTFSSLSLFKLKQKKFKLS
ncbi:MAG: radical SAM protein [Candidatus Omnitrophota bacterium]